PEQLHPRSRWHSRGRLTLTYPKPMLKILFATSMQWSAPAVEAVHYSDQVRERIRFAARSHTWGVVCRYCLQDAEPSYYQRLTLRRDGSVLYMDQGNQESTPETLRNCAKETERTRNRYLFEIDEAGVDCNAEQYYPLALTPLAQAQRYFNLAALAETHGLAMEFRRWV